MKLWLRTLACVALAGHVLIAQQAPAREQARGPARTAAGTASASPESVGLSTERLGRLHAAMQGYVDRKEAGGVVTLVARDGRVADLHAVGFQDVEKGVQMKTDSIFRIASMTKPITSVAVMMLAEEGKLRIADPVSKFIPAFRGQQVIAEGGTTVPARREITIRDLLSHRSGITYGFINAGPVGEAYRKNGVTDGLTTTDMTLAEAIDKLAKQPLLVQPGSAWNYGLSVDVLGRVVEVASGQTLDVFFRDRIFRPLGMADTSFSVEDSKWSRFVTVYSPAGSGGGIRPMQDPEAFRNTHMSPFASYKPTKKYFSGGAGLTSTARDYWRFAQMLLNGGELDGQRLLSPKTIELMTSSHTKDLPSAGFGPGLGFGLGFSIVMDVPATVNYGSPGMFGWTGIYGTVFWVDPKERLVAIMLVQRYPGSPVADLFQPLVYQAIVK